MKKFNLMRNVAVATALIASSFTMANAQEYRLGDFQSTTHIVSINATTFWMDEVEKLTNGDVSFKHFPAQQAAKSKGLLDAVRGGVIDMALIGTIYYGEDLPLNSVVGLPGFYTSAVKGTEVMQKMVADGPLRDEILATDVIPLFSFVLPPYQILSKEDRLGDPSEWKNLKIRTSGATQAMVARSLSAVGVSMPGPDTYTSVERGRLDGVLFPLASVPAYNLQEVVKHISTNGSFGGYSFVMVMNGEAYAELSDASKQALIEAGKRAAINVAKAQDDSIGTLIEEWKSQGINTYEFTAEETASIKAAMSQVEQDWVARIGKNAPKAEMVLNQYKDLNN